MTVAFVLGNGKSRLELDLHQLKQTGPIYACNAIYRTFTPDCLVATDAAIARAIQESGYAKTNRFHTRRPIEGLGARSLPKEYRGFSSGPNALDGPSTRTNCRRSYCSAICLICLIQLPENVGASVIFL